MKHAYSVIMLISKGLPKNKKDRSLYFQLNPRQNYSLIILLNDMIAPSTTKVYV